MSEPVRRAHRSGVRDLAGHNSGRIDPNHRVVPGGFRSPLNNVIRFDEAIELRQTQRAAIPLQRSEAARLAFSTGFKSKEAQLVSLYRDFGSELGE